ncbi:hypothetical protein C380_10815 [Acidovorax sp. KKS102]|uniref:hypothetical protein n=1 Tax=Acidovorax sp. KKS102 TaxID=358220 RepID=UPI00028B161E|nr:hypothetical protein [Acidovorax sp. KKS102]AFU45864.1 hypothetical protein C380_10815 [Acidovorax sp. KKS102]
MQNVHDTFQRIFATNPAVPQKMTRSEINDDDTYVIDVARRTIVGQYGPSSATAQVARTQGLPLRPGQALLRGMQLKGSGLIDLEAA